MALRLSQLLVGVVFAWNLQCAVAFLFWPAVFAPGFELAGAVGEAVLRGMGVLFLMWNVPYGAAMWHPVRHRLALLEALVMQTIGLVGESWIFTTLSASEHAVARQSLARFIAFDALGLASLVLAAWFSRKS